MNEVVRGAISGLARTDPQKAWQLAKERFKDDAGAGRQVIHHLAEAAVRNGGTAGLERWFSGIMNGRDGTAGLLPELAVEAVAKRMMHASQEQGMAWAAAQAAQPWHSDRAIALTAAALAGKHPELAVQWSADLPAGKDPSNPHPGLGASVADWASTNSEAMAGWIEAHPSPSVRDASAAAVASYYWKDGDPQTARAWAATIQSEAIRRTVNPGVWQAGETTAQ